MKSLCVYTVTVSLTLSGCSWALAQVWGQRMFAILFCVKGTEICLSPVLTLPNTTPETLQLVRQSNQKAASISFPNEAEIQAALDFSPWNAKMVETGRTERNFYTFALCHGRRGHCAVCFTQKSLLSVVPVTSQCTTCNACTSRLQRDTLPSSNQARPRELVSNLFFPPSWPEQTHSCSSSTSWVSGSSHVVNGYGTSLQALRSIIYRKASKCIRWTKDLNPLFIGLKQR